ncbi:MAG: TRAP transporter substrate-binding protein DctP [Candidatus Binatia bacterium]
MSIAKTVSILLLGLVGCGGSGPQPYAEDDTLTLRVVSQFPRESVLAAGTRMFGEELQQILGERLRLQGFYGSALVTGEETLGAIGHGVADAGTGMWIYSPGRLPLGSLEYQFIFNDPDFRTQARIKREMFETIPALAAELEAANVAPPLVFGPLSPYLLLSREPMDDLSDLRGKRIGFTPVEYVPLFRSFGAVPILSPGPELYERMSLGIVDVVALPVEILYLFRLNEIAPYLLDFALNTPTPLGVWVNLDYWKALTPADRDAFREAGRRAEQRYLTLLEGEVRKARKALEAAGVHFTRLSDEAARDALAGIPPFARQWADRMNGRGLPGSQVVDTYVNLSQRSGWEFGRGATH